MKSANVGAFVAAMISLMNHTDPEWRALVRAVLDGQEPWYWGA